MNTRSQTGVRGETLVADHLRRLGYEIIERNARVGHHELDIIARHGEVVIFCEVRTRTSAMWLDPMTTIDRAKIARTRRAAASWLQANRIRAREIRFDAAAVVLEGDAPSIRYYEAAF